MREIRLSGSEGGGTEFNRPSLPLSICFALWGLLPGVRVGDKVSVFALPSLFR